MTTAAVTGQVRCHRGASAIAELAAPLVAAGIEPLPMMAMDPNFLAEGFEGGEPSALVYWVNGVVAGYLPFVIRRITMRPRVGPVRFGRFAYRQLRLYGYAASSQTGSQALDTLLEELKRNYGSQYDRGAISELSLENPLAIYLQTPRRDAIFTGSCRTMDSYRISLTGTFDDYLANRFSSKGRHNLKRTVRLMSDAANGNLHLRIFDTPGEVQTFLRDAEHIARNTYQWRDGFDVARCDSATQMKYELLAARGWFRSYILYANNTPAAYCLGTVYGRRFGYDITGYDERSARLSPGTVLLYKILEDLFAARVADELDFGLGSGNYKRAFSTSNPCVLVADLDGSGPYSVFLKALTNGAQLLTRTAKQVAHSSLYKRVTGA